MNPEQIRTLLRQTPFVPFRIHVSGGKSYDVRHPEMVIPTPASIYIGVVANRRNETSETPDLMEIVSNLHVIRLEPIVPERVA